MVVGRRQKQAAWRRLASQMGQGSSQRQGRTYASFPPPISPRVETDSSLVPTSGSDWGLGIAFTIYGAGGYFYGTWQGNRGSGLRLRSLNVKNILFNSPEHAPVQISPAALGGCPSLSAAEDGTAGVVRDAVRCCALTLLFCALLCCVALRLYLCCVLLCCRSLQW